MPRQSNMVVIDWQLTINSVLLTILNNGVLASLVWDSETGTAICMITLTDLLRIMLDKTVDYHQVLNRPLRTWLMANSKDHQNLTVIYAEDSLLSAVKVLCGVRLHRIPLSALPVPPEMYKPLDSLPFGVWSNIQCTTLKETVSAALSQIFSSNISSLPVVMQQESQSSVQNILTKVDVVNYLADFGWKNLDEITVEEVCRSRKQSVEGLVMCNRCTPLLFALELLVRNSAHRLIVVDSCITLCGVISVADLLSAIIA
ncbi:unnamed protein product [Soboliphyme baturini]|uniref:CBS domain-containing protein n=1 Tax=Soboliphyme baturini TaxID=241478 RepID=A0A183IZW9_9BILA|nr:unnamed protein product [Soboliphyme baturini]